MNASRMFWYLVLLMAFNQCSENVGDAIVYDKPIQQPAVQQATCTTNIFPANEGSVPDGARIYLSWWPTTNADRYELYLGVGDNEPSFITNLSATSYAFDVPPGIDVTYKWYVRAKKSNGDYIDCLQISTVFVTKEIPPLSTEQIIVNVLVLNFDPVIDGEKTLHEFYQWNNPRTIASAYIDDVFSSSHNLIKYNIVEWRDINAFPNKMDGFIYTPAKYRAVMANPDNHHSPDDADYARIIKEQKIVEGIDNDVFEEVWIFNAPYFGFWESAMAGPQSFSINGGTYPQILSKKAFAIMGFSYERGVAEMLHDLCHRSEATLSKVYNGWNAATFESPWERFAANIKQSRGQAGVGSCHYPPNAVADYDYADPTFVKSSADDWLNYPVLSGLKKKINNETWGGPDYQRNYLNWWFAHLPHREGVAPDGKLNNWWRYIFEFNETLNQ